MYGMQQQHRMNRLVVLLVALLLSNVAAFACAAAYAFCIDCPQHPPVACVDPCTTADAVTSKPSAEVLDTTYRPIVYASPPIATDPPFGLSAVGVAATEVADLPPVLPLNLRFCVFLN